MSGCRRGGLSTPQPESSPQDTLLVGFTGHCPASQRPSTAQSPRTPTDSGRRFYAVAQSLPCAAGRVPQSQLGKLTGVAVRDSVCPRAQDPSGESRGFIHTSPEVGPLPYGAQTVVCSWGPLSGGGAQIREVLHPMRV